MPSARGKLPSVSYDNITTDRQLRQFCRRLAQRRSIAFDTEFVSERTYRPLLCLVQIEADGQLAMIDALAVGDMTPFWEVIAEPGHQTIVHAGRGEVEFCLQAVGRPPAELVDVQITAGLAGIEYPAGFGTLMSRLLGESTKKAETRTDWRRRPLSSRQIEYALDDVRYLPPIWEALRQRIEKLGRQAWLAEEMAAWQQRICEAFTQERWQRVSGNSGLSSRSLAVLRELWRWREAEAQRRDCPVRRVLRDDLMVELARRKTASLKRIQAVRGLDRGDLKRQLPRIAECIQRALELPEADCPKTMHRGRMAQLSELGQFLYAALASLCRQGHLSPGLVGTPSDIRELISYRIDADRHRQPPSLARGWRAEFIGRSLDDLLAGKATIRIVDPLADHPLVVEPIAPHEDRPNKSAEA